MMQTERRHHFSREKHHVPYRKPVAQIQHFDWSDFVVPFLKFSLVTDQGNAKKYEYYLVRVQNTGTSTNIYRSTE